MATQEFHPGPVPRVLSRLPLWPGVRLYDPESQPTLTGGLAATLSLLVCELMYQPRHDLSPETAFDYGSGRQCTPGELAMAQGRDKHSSSQPAETTINTGRLDDLGIPCRPSLKQRNKMTLLPFHTSCEHPFIFVTYIGLWGKGSTWGGDGLKTCSPLFLCYPAIGPLRALH